ncbi:MAG: preprotein translocase subunit SecG [Candidatus Omnitrophota bacterium]|jgi:preprotein translocase subunit SecG
MMLFVIIIHVIICALLITIILIQAGRGGGLVESFSGVESMFGPKTNAFLTRATTILAILFFITCISLAFLSARQSRSLMRDVKGASAPAVLPPAAEPPAAPAVPQTP